MKKRLILILAALVVCAALGVGIWQILKIDPIPPEDTTPPEFGLSMNDEGLRVYHFSPANVDYLEVENTHGTYRVRMVDGNVTIVGYEQIPLLQASSVGLFNSVATVTLETVIAEHCTDLSEFGLAEPQGKVNIKAYGGAQIGLCIGNHTLTGNYYYMCVDGEDTVFLMDGMLAERYLLSVEEYCDPKIYRPFEGMSDLQALKAGEYTVYRVTQEERDANGLYFSGFRMEQPFDWGMDSSSLETICNSFLGLTASQVVRLCVTPEDLAAYGLDAEHATEVVLSLNADPNPMMFQNYPNPYYDASLPTGEKQDFELCYRFGASKDHLIYVQYGDIPVVYAVSDSAFDWLSWTPYRYAVKMVFGEFITNVTQIDVTAAGQTDSFVLIDPEARSEMRVTCGSKEIDQAQFRTFYGDMMAMYPTGEATREQITGAALLTLTVQRKNGEPIVLTLYPMDSRNCAVEVGGEVHLSVRINDVNKVISDRDKLLAGQALS